MIFLFLLLLLLGVVFVMGQIETDLVLAKERNRMRNDLLVDGDERISDGSVVIAARGQNGQCRFRRYRVSSLPLQVVQGTVKQSYPLRGLTAMS